MKRHGFLMFSAILIVTNLLTFTLAAKLTGGLSPADGIKLRMVENIIEKDYLREVDPERFYIGQLKGVVASLGDPYSEYLTKEEFAILEESTSGMFYGVGIVVAPGEDGLITVISPIKGSPADRAGIAAGDKIVKVDGKEYTADTLQDAVKVMKGEEGTKVDLEILSAKEKKIKEIPIVREKVVVETVISQKLGNIGYLGITQFNDNTASEFNKALDELEAQGVEGLVLDLRGNPGGLVDASTAIADRLLGKGTIVTSKNREGKVVDEAISDEKKWDKPMAVLINKGSASASEILAGAIQDFNAGPLIGETSFGKGVIQRIRRFPGGDGLKLTIAEYFTPSGVNIHGIGIDPDQEVLLPPDVHGIGPDHLEEDTQLQAALEAVKK